MSAVPMGEMGKTMRGFTHMLDLAWKLLLKEGF